MDNLSRSLLASAIVIGLVLCAEGGNPDEKNGGKTDSKYDVTTKTFDRRGKCIQEIKIKGNGVEDSFRQPCVDGLEVVNTDDVLIIGEPDKTPFCLFSDSPATLVVVEDGGCMKKTYTTAKGKTTSSSSDLDVGECEELEKKIKEVVDKKKEEAKKGVNKEESKYEVSTETFKRRGRCIQEIKIKGNGVEDSFKGRCVEGLEVVNTGGVLIIGEPDKTPSCWFSEEPGTLVVLKDGGCTKKSYTTVDGKTTSSSSDLDFHECDEIEERIKKELEKNKKETKKVSTREPNPSTPAKPTELQKPTNHRPQPQEAQVKRSGSKLYEVSTDKSTAKGKCVQEIKIKGNGVEDVFKEPCESSLKVDTSNDVLIIGDPYKPPLCLFSDQRDILVVIKNGQCKKRVYTTVKRKTASSSLIMEEEECEDVQKEIADRLKMIGGGG